MGRFLTILTASFLMTACSLTPTQKKWAGVAAGVLVVGAIAAHDSDSGKPQTGGDLASKPACTPQPNGSCR